MIDEQMAQVFLRLSHDLRSPLTVLTGTLVELQLGSDASLSRIETADLAKRSLLRIGRMAERLSLSGQLAQGIAPLLQSVNLFDLTRSAVERIRFCEPRKKIETEWACPEGRPLARTDPGLLGALVSELFSNAQKHAQCRVWVTVSSQSVALEDDGDGVPPQDLPDIFTRIRPGPSGLGLGLSLAYSLAQTLGGHLELERREEAGPWNRFVFRLG